jgi:glycosyltransferase involved in cell wall biosynthesis
MKVLIISSSDKKGGASIAATRLHNSLLKKKINSIMFVQNKYSDYKHIFSNSNKILSVFNILRPYIDSIIIKLFYPKPNSLFSPSILGFSSILNIINNTKPDLIHIHWVCGGMMKISDLKKIKIPIIISLHDMWFFTGGCHYNDQCFNYLYKCHKCPVLKSKKIFDLSTYLFQNKYKTFQKINSNITFIGLSKWITKEAKDSFILKNSNIYNLPNPIDTDTFKPLDKIFCRKLFNLPLNKKLILFGSYGSINDTRKGFSELIKSFSNFNDNHYEFVVIGDADFKFNLKINIVSLNLLQDEWSLVALYNAIDLTIFPSLQENFSNIILESLSCGTPVVAFNIGGNTDLIKHKYNGYLSNLQDSNSLLNGVSWVFNSNIENIISINARDSVVNNFDFNTISEKYINLYKKILN